jgi:hypothetical protein
MEKTIFYSWQSDLPSNTNRNFIENALRNAIRSIVNDQNAIVEPVIDRDTYNIAGTPDIAHSILAKISTASAFLGDVSILDAKAARPAPNPNVLVELGYAAAKLGWENIILVLNTEFGGPDLLPFDLRGRRIVTYTTNAANKIDKKQVSGLLQGRLENELRNILEVGATGQLPTGRNSILWWGTWGNYNAEIWSETLFIREIGSDGFLFDLRVNHGAHYGQVTAYARIIGKDLAYCRLPNGVGQPDGELIFRRNISQGIRIIDIEEPNRCISHCGARAYFSGRLIREREPWFDAGYLNELEVARLYGMLGEHFSKMSACTGDIGERENLDESMRVRVYWGGIPGLYTAMESIVMLSESGQMWAAYIDDDLVRYFTNVPTYRNVLPDTIENWRTSFSDKKVIYCDPVTVIPSYSMEESELDSD